MSWTARLVGYLHPDGWWLGRHELPDLHDAVRQRRIGSLRFSASAGVVLAEGVFEDDFEIDNVDLRVTIEGIIRPFIAAFAVADGSGFDFRITHIDRNDGLKAYDSIFPELANIGLDAARIQKHLRHNLALREAVCEFADAVNNPGATARSSYRGVEAIRSYFGPATQRGWASMHEALHTRRELIDPLAIAAQPQRHAETPGDLRTAAAKALGQHGITAADRRGQLSILRVLIERFIEWLDGQDEDRPFDLPVLERLELSNAGTEAPTA